MPRLTPKQIANRIIWNRFKRKWIKRLTPDEVIAPFIGGLLIICSGLINNEVAWSYIMEAFLLFILGLFLMVLVICYLGGM